MSMKFGKIITNTRPNGLDIYLDGQPVLDSSGNIAKTPTVILNVAEGVHSVTFSRIGYDTTTVMVNVPGGSDCYARAILSVKSIRYPMMLGQQSIPFGNLVANTIPEGAEIYIDGQPIFDAIGKVLTTPANVLGIIVGKHTMTLRKKGYSDQNIELYIENGLYSDASALLIPIMVGSKPIVILEPEKGEIMIDTTPAGAHVYIDGKDMVDKSGAHIRTPAKLSLNSGWHDLVVYLEKYCRDAVPIYIYGNATTSVHRYLFQPPCE